MPGASEAPARSDSEPWPLSISEEPGEWGGSWEEEVEEAEEEVDVWVRKGEPPSTRGLCGLLGLLGLRGLQAEGLWTLTLSSVSAFVSDSREGWALLLLMPSSWLSL